MQTLCVCGRHELHLQKEKLLLLAFESYSRKTALLQKSKLVLLLLQLTNLSSFLNLVVK